MHRATLTFIIAVSLTAAAAQAQTVAVFDGTYNGVSATVQKFGSMNASCRPPDFPVPSTLTVSNGTARTAGGLQGTVSPQGALLMRGSDNVLREGQIDAQGNATLKFSGTQCLYTSTWRKAAR